MGLLLIAGMRRSGSTVAFQIAYRLVGGRKYRLRYTDTPSHIAKLHAVMHAAKTHAYLSQLIPLMKEGNVHVIITCRDPRDIAVSMMRLRKHTFDEVMASNQVQHSIDAHQQWERTGLCHQARYENFVNDLGSLVRIITGAANINIDDAKVGELAERFSLERNKERALHLTNIRHDLLFPGHIQDGSVGQWQERLDNEQLKRIYAFAGEWMSEHGYEMKQ